MCELTCEVWCPFIKYCRHGTRVNCSEKFHDDLEKQLEFFDQAEISSINSTILENQFMKQHNKLDFVCNEFKYLIDSLVDNNVPSTGRLKEGSNFTHQFQRFSKAFIRKYI